MTSETRQEFIRAAITFLQNPKLVDSPLKDKLKFLKDKGLNELEVDEALNLALINRHQAQNGKWNFLLISGLCLLCFHIYKTYLESKKDYLAQQKLLEEQKEEEARKKEAEREQTLRMERDAPTLHEILQKMSELKKLVELQRSNFSSDIQSLKTLLLGHEKFAAPPIIPPWQLEGFNEKESSEKTLEGGNLHEVSKSEKNGKAQRSRENSLTS